MRSDPEPEYTPVEISAECSMMLAHAHRPEPLDMFEMQRWMAKIALHQPEVLVGERSNGGRQRVILAPKRRGRAMIQIWRERPAR